MTAFRYATDETPGYMPLAIVLAHKVNAALVAAHRSGLFTSLCPDSKTQATVHYKKDRGAVNPLRVNTIVISAQHAMEISIGNPHKEV